MITIFGTSDSYSGASRTLYQGSQVGELEHSQKGLQQLGKTAEVLPVLKRHEMQMSGHDMSHLQGREVELKSTYTKRKEKEEAEKKKSPEGEGSSTLSKPKVAQGKVLTLEEQRQVQKLKERDAEVRRHEQAHASAGGPHTGTPSYEYEVGPDGKRYIVDGEVSVDASPIRGNPEATIQKMRQVKAAALAPSNPSTQDRRVAAKAAALLLQAQQELAARKAALRDFSDGTNSQIEGEAASEEINRTQGAQSYRTVFSASSSASSSIEVLSCSECGNTHSF